MMRNLQGRFAIHTIMILVLSSFFSSEMEAQTDVMFTKYQFNSLAFNPGYSGSKEFMTMNFLHRTQWLGVKGAPSAQTFTVHTPFKGFDRIGIGATLFNQSVGVNQNMGLNLSYAYRIRLGKGEDAATISVGLQGGIMNMRTKVSELNPKQQEDLSFDGMNTNAWLPNFGAGIYLYSKKYYFGFSSPSILEHDLRKNNEVIERVNAKTFRHYYAIAGGAIPFGDGEFVFKPSALFKTTSLLGSFKNDDDLYKNYGSPMELTVDLSVLFHERLWVGLAYRLAIEQFNKELTKKSSHDSVDAWITFYLNERLHFGASYDYPLTPIQNSTRVSFEINVGYDFNVKQSKTYSPRYF